MIKITPFSRKKLCAAAEGLFCFMLARAPSFVLSGYGGLHSSRRVLYGKLKARHIDARANAQHEGEEDEKLSGAV